MATEEVRGIKTYGHEIRPTMNSQCAQILAHLKAGRSITALECLMAFGCLRLAARIADLRQSGYTITTDFVKKNGKRFASYRM